jgi:hypothetical protein
VTPKPKRPDEQQLAQQEDEQKSVLENLVTVSTGKTKHMDDSSI